MRAALRALLQPSAMPLRGCGAAVVLTLVLSHASPVRADAVVDLAAPASQQAVVSRVSDVPVVGITTPDAAGISHNRWTTFDVSRHGLVFNNSTSPASSVLAGPLPTNAALNGSAARVILNEVSGSQRSLLRGSMEIAGQAARLVISNPNGITCDGCGFINTPHVQLSTGRIERLNEALSFDVTGGRIDIGAGGLSALATRLDLIAHALRSTGPIATDSTLNVIAGRTRVVADTLALGNADAQLPEDFEAFSIDIGQSVSAASIQLIAVGGELGVRSTARMIALDDVVIATRGHVELSGDLTAGRDIALYNIGAFQSVLRGTLTAGLDVTLLATGLTLADSGRLVAGGDIGLGFFGDNSDRWSAFRNDGLIDAGAALTFAGPAIGLNTGVILAGASIDAASGSARARAGDAGLPGSHAERAAEADDVTLANSGVIHAGSDLFLNLIDNSGDISAGRDVFLSQARRGQPDALAPEHIDLAGEVNAGRDLFIHTPVEGSQWLAGARRQSFTATRNLHLVDRPWLSDAGTPAHGSAQQPYMNRDRLTAGHDLTIALNAHFINPSVIDAGRDLLIGARGISNETAVGSRQASFDYPYYPGCRTEYDGLCTTTIEMPSSHALMLVGRDLAATTTFFRNRGASILAGRDIRIDAPDVLNEDRRYGAVWSSSYYLIDVDAQSVGTPCTSDCVVDIDWRRTASGALELGVLPGVIQAAGGFVSDGGPVSPYPAPPKPSPHPQEPAPAVSAPASGTLTEALARMLSTGVLSLTDAPPPLSSFVNSGNIHAASIVVRAADIRNGFDVVADYYHRTAEPTVPPARIEVAGFGIHGSSPLPALTAARYSGAALMGVLPPGLVSLLPFALTPAEEAAALRNAFLATTRRGWILPGLTWDALTGQSPQQQEHAILAANGAAFAIAHGIAMGADLTAAQQSLLGAPVLWYAARSGRLHPIVYLPSDWQAQLAVVPGGGLDAGVAIELTGERVDNTGFVLSGGALTITADTLLNRKRSAFFYEKRKVSGGTLTIEGDTVQPGGFMQAAVWNLQVASVSSVSGEFRVPGEDAAHTGALSRAFETQIAAELGDAFHYEEARDNLRYRFRKSGSFGNLVGVIAGFTASMLIGPQMSNFLGSLAASHGPAWSAATAFTAPGLANVAGTAAITQTLSSAIGQFIATGRFAIDPALTSGLAGALTAGAGAWANAHIESAAGRWSVRALTTGAVGELTGAGFDNALFNAVINEASALGANQIGHGNFGPQGSLGHTLAHGVLGALTAAARGEDPYSGAFGAITATLVEAPLDDALDLSGPDREIALTAFSMLVGGTASGLAGGDPVTAGWAAQNVTLFNYLKHQEQDRYADARNACGGDAACLNAVDADFNQKSQANKRVLAAAREACEATGFCSDFYRLMTEAVPLGMGAQLPGDMDPENPWLGAQQDADAVAHNLTLFDRLMARPLSDEIVRQDFVPDPEAYAFAAQGSSQYVGAITARNIDNVVVLSAAGASLLLPGPEDLVIGAVLMTKAGQFVARVIEVGGQKLLRLADGAFSNGDGLISETSSARSSITLVYDRATKIWKTPAGLDYGIGSIHGNRIKHVLDHVVQNPNKRRHTVFSVERNQVLALIDEAWEKRGQPLLNDPGSYVISLGRVVGTTGETRIKIVVRPGTNKLITAYPVK
jgi:filamentous hemagglutinin